MITIYVDMDGVLCDFKSAYKQFYISEEFNKAAFDNFVLADGFATLENMPNTMKLLRELQGIEYDNKNINIEILSSAGNSTYYNLVCKQKREWLNSRGVVWTANFVQHKGLKKLFATPKAILIDDTKQNIYDFNEHHGHSVYYKDNNYESCIDKLHEILYHVNINTEPNYTFIGS